MKRLIYIFLLLSIFACDDYVDIEPKGKFIPTTFEDYKLLLNKGYTLYGAGYNGSGGFVGTASLMLMATDDYYVNDEQLYSVSSGFSKRFKDMNARVYKYEKHVYNPDQEDYDWAQLYWVISRCNIVLDGIKGIEHDNQEEYNQVKGEALVHRADAYLALVNLYAKHYNKSTASTDLGVPLLDKFDLFANLNRETVQTIYDFILTDLNEVVDNDLMVDNSDYTARPDKASAYAVLSRTYLYMGEYDKALSNANKALEISSELNNYSGLPASNLTSVYSWVSSNYEEDPEVLLYKRGTQPQGYLYSPTYNLGTRAILSKELENLYEEGDLRMDLLCADAYSIDGYKEMRAKYQLQVNYGPTVAEMMLIKAECLARDGQKDLAMDEINELRRNRFAEDADTPDYYELSAVDKADALEKVLNERRRELAFTGKRLFDIKRLNLDSETPSITLNRVSQGKTITIEPNDDMWVFPIPRNVIAKNPEIEQNPRGL